MKLKKYLIPGAMAMAAVFAYNAHTRNLHQVFPGDFRDALNDAPAAAGDTGLGGVDAASVTRGKKAVAVSEPVKVSDTKAENTDFTCSGENGTDKFLGTISAERITGITLAGQYAAIPGAELKAIPAVKESAAGELRYGNLITTAKLSTEGMNSGAFAAVLEQKKDGLVSQARFKCKMDGFVTIAANGKARFIAKDQKAKSPALKADGSKPGTSAGNIAQVNFGIGLNASAIAGPNHVYGGGFDLGPVVSLQLLPHSQVGMQINLQPGAYWGSGTVKEGVTTNVLYDKPETALMGNQWRWTSETTHYDDGSKIYSEWLTPDHPEKVTLTHKVTEEMGGQRTVSSFSYYTIGNALATVTTNLGNYAKTVFYGGVGLAYRDYKNYTESYHNITRTDDYINNYKTYNEEVGRNTYTDAKGNSTSDYSTADVWHSDVQTKKTTLLDESFGVSARKHVSGFVPTVMLGATTMIGEKLSLNMSVSRVLSHDVESRMWNVAVGLVIHL